MDSLENRLERRSLAKQQRFYEDLCFVNMVMGFAVIGLLIGILLGGIF